MNREQITLVITSLIFYFIISTWIILALDAGHYQNLILYHWGHVLFILLFTLNISIIIYGAKEIKNINCCYCFQSNFCKWINVIDNKIQCKDILNNG